MDIQQLLTKLAAEFPNLRFRAGQEFCWSPDTEEIFYKTLDGKALATNERQKATWSLLHETGHALLEHKMYTADFHLLRLEISAWERARHIAQSLDIVIDEGHIQDCLDTYRDWLYQRSICPKCHTKCLQQGDLIHYRCFNCHSTWRVSTSRFCRAYRATKNVIQTPAFHFDTSF